MMSFRLDHGLHTLTHRIDQYFAGLLNFIVVIPGVEKRTNEFRLVLWALPYYSALDDLPKVFDWMQVR